MKNRTVWLYMAFVFLSNFSTILYFLTVYLEFVGFSMVAISGMMIAYQVSKFALEIPTGYIADRFGRKISGLVGIAGMLGYYAALLLIRSPLLLIGAFALKGFAVASGMTIAVQLLVSASIGFIVPSVIAHVDKRLFARICGIIRLILAALFLTPFIPVDLLPVFYVLQTVAYSLFAPIKYSVFQNAADSSMLCSLISVQSQMVAVGAVLFYLLNAVLSSVVGIRVVLLVALGISSLAYVPALFRLTSRRP